MKKAILFILITMILASSLTITYGNINDTANKFSDVSKNDWFAPTVDKLVEMGGIEGYSDGTFRPNKTMTQAEFIKTVIATLHDEEPIAKNQHWAMNYIKEAEKLGYIDEGEYRESDLNQAINRYQMAKIIVRAVAAQGEEFSDNRSDYATVIKDYNEVPSKYQAYVLKAYSHGLLMGYPQDGEFKGTRSLTRAEAATVVIRIFDKSARVVPKEPKPKDKSIPEGYMDNNGFIAPIETDIKFRGKDTHNNLAAGYMLGIHLDLEKQFEELETILSFSFSDKTTKAIMDHVKQKTDRDTELDVLKIEEDNYRIWAEGTDFVINITIYYK